MELRIVAQLLLLLLGVSEKLANVLFALAHVLVQYLRAVDDLRLCGFQELRQLPRDQRLTRSWGSVQKHPTDVVDTELPDQVLRKDTSSEGPAENVAELLGQAADAQLLEVEVGPEDAALGGLVAQDLHLARSARLETNLRGRGEKARPHLGHGLAVPYVNRRDRRHVEPKDVPAFVLVHDGLSHRQVHVREPFPENRLQVFL
mmetsp:Transcript_107685/g.303347  ORF Transcript_107685/g.303347 Transcript_107685/m.303347 type:complete len:203 (-) Transcript_107685:448-1056(-)